MIACEDTRRTRVLLDRYGVTARLVPYHEHNERERTPELVARMRDGAVVALVSDAGMPRCQRPGVLARAGLRGGGARGRGAAGAVGGAGRAVASALPSDVWRFVGFLPRKRAGLVDVFGSGETVVAFESPRRVAVVAGGAGVAGSGRPAAVCRELTKLHEEFVRGTAAELAARYASSEPRGEVVPWWGRAGADGGAGGGGRRGPAAGGVGGAGAGGGGGRGELTGASANALYKAVAER